MATINVSLSSEAARVVTEEIESGEFPTATEVVEEALRALQERDDRKERERIDALIHEAADSDAEEWTEQDWDDMRREAFALARSRKSG
jgi:putative addiction module CopG family antidote